MSASSRGIEFIAHSDQGGRPDGVQVMVHRGYAYIGHTFSGGFSIIDVHDTKNPKAAGFVAGPIRNSSGLLLQLPGPGLQPLQPNHQFLRVLASSVLYLFALIILLAEDAIYLIPGVGGVSSTVAVEHSG